MFAGEWGHLYLAAHNLARAGCVVRRLADGDDNGAQGVQELVPHVYRCASRVCRAVPWPLWRAWLHCLRTLSCCAVGHTHALVCTDGMCALRVRFPCVAATCTLTYPFVRVGRTAVRVLSYVGCRRASASAVRGGCGQGFAERAHVRGRNAPPKRRRCRRSALLPQVRECVGALI